jgi:hypothetical protein
MVRDSNTLPSRERKGGASGTVFFDLPVAGYFFTLVLICAHEGARELAFRGHTE